MMIKVDKTMISGHFLDGCIVPDCFKMMILNDGVTLKNYEVEESGEYMQIVTTKPHRIALFTYVVYAAAITCTCGL